jgi:hypothetical protein
MLTRIQSEFDHNAKSSMDDLAINGKIIIIGASDELLELYLNFFFFAHRSAVVG